MLNSADLLAALPDGLRAPLLATYREIATNFVERRWEPSELNGGKFCEVVHTVIAGWISGTFPPTPVKPANMRDACLALERLPSNPQLVGDRSVRVLIPRMLVTLYEIRNNRGVGHVGGDVSPNEMDAAAVFSMCSWVMAELVRIFHSVPVQVAQQSVNVLAERKSPLIWEVGESKRVLDPTLSTQDQTLALLYHSLAWVHFDQLVAWVEYKGKSMFAARVLLPLHRRRLIEYDAALKRAQISPAGARYVETDLLMTRT